MLPQPKQWQRGSGLLATPRNVKVRRPARLFAPSQADQVRIIDRDINGFLAELSAMSSATIAKHKTLRHLDLRLIDPHKQSGDRLPAEGYQLVIGPEAIELTGADGPGLRAGLVSLSKLLVHKDGLTWLPQARITDWPDLPLRGFHLDLTCQTLSFDYACSLLQRLAGFKYNAVLLEWADKFPYQGHRTLSHPDAFTQRQVSSLLELAESLGVVVIPLVQTLGHAQFILRHPQFAHLSEVPGDIYQLATGNPESLVLAKQLVDQLIESHPNSPYVHLGGDEATQLGTGVSAEQVARKGASLAWVEYMNVICRHVQARGRTPIVWDDVLLGRPQALNRFTRDCLLMHWNYTTTSKVAADYHQPGIGRINGRTYDRLEPDVRERFEPFWAMHGAKPPKTFYTHGPVVYLQEAGFKVVLAPSVRSFGDSYSAPRLSVHRDNCMQMAEAAVELGSLGLLVTSWSIRRTPVETTVPGLIIAAEAAWNGGKPPRNLDALLAEELAVSRNGELIRTLDLVSQSGFALLNGIGPSSGAWDRRRDRWGISPLLARMRKADLVSMPPSSPQVKLARTVQRELKSAAARLARVTGSAQMHPTFLATWRYAAHETQHKASQWLFLWQVFRLVQADSGNIASLASQGAAVLEDIRRCTREFKRAVGPSLAGSGVEEELDVHYGGEARLIRRIVRTLRQKLTRAKIRSQLAEMLGLADPAST